MIKVFQINECDWYAGDCSKEEILAAYMEDTGCSLDEATGILHTTLVTYAIK